MRVVARMLSQEQDGIPGYVAHPEAVRFAARDPDGPPAHGVTADYRIDAHRLATLGFNVLVPSLCNARCDPQRTTRAGRS